MRTSGAMRVVVVGTGYVGLVAGVCLADAGASVLCVDVDHAKIADLQRGRVPIYEPGLSEILSRTMARGTLQFGFDLAGAVPGADVILIAVGTPPALDGSSDLGAVFNVARVIGQHLDRYAVVATKSTVPVGTGLLIQAAIESELNRRGSGIEFDIASNPEFMKEGDAIADFMRPDRIIVGVQSRRSREVMSRLYRPFVAEGHPLIFMDVASAEITKYAANAMLATRISFMNMIAELCETYDADVDDVRIGIGSDPRIGSQFLYPGIGYGGSCFPKDVRALEATAASRGIDSSLLAAVERINTHQKVRLVDRADAILGGLESKHIAMWGLAFKPNTDDVRESPALLMIDELVRRGATVAVFDPVAESQARLRIGDLCAYAPDAYSALDSADALILATEWPEFRSPDVQQMAERMRGRLVLDGRNVLDGRSMTDAGFRYECIGRPRAGRSGGEVIDE